MSAPPFPTILFQDNFSTYPINGPPGNGPTGWFNQFGGPSSANVINDPYGFFYHVLQLGLNSSGITFIPPYRTPLNAASIFFAFEGNYENTAFVPLLQFVGLTPFSDFIPICGLALEDDQTLSIRTSSADPGAFGTVVPNSNTQVPVNNGWNYVQVNIQIGYAVVNGVTYIQGTFGIALNGVTYVPSAVGILIPALDLVNGLALIYEFLWINPNPFGGPGLLGDVYICEFTVLNNFPFPPVVVPPKPLPSYMNMSQGIVDVAETPDNPNLRSSQGIVEVCELPLVQKSPLKEFPNLRATQCIIELMATGPVNPAPPTPQNSWKVTES